MDTRGTSPRRPPQACGMYACVRAGQHPPICTRMMRQKGSIQSLCGVAFTPDRLSLDLDRTHAGTNVRHTKSNHT